MDVFVEVKLSVPQNWLSDPDKFGSWEELLKERAKNFAAAIEGQRIQVKSGLCENIAMGRVLKVTQVTQKGTVLFP